MQTPMRVVATRSLIASAVAWVGSLLGAVEYVASNQWTGARELLGMMLWTVAFAMVVAIAAIALLPTLQALKPLWACVVVMILGPALGFGTFLLAVALRGGWVVAFPAFTCWAFGGLAGLLALTGISHPRSWFAVTGIAGVAFAVLVWAHSVLLRLG